MKQAYEKPVLYSDRLEINLLRGGCCQDRGFCEPCPATPPADHLSTGPCDEYNIEECGGCSCWPETTQSA